MWQELYKTALRYLLRLGVSRQDAEDLAQEALLSIYLNLDGIEPGKLCAYLLAAARHKHIDFLRKSKKIRAVTLVDEILTGELVEAGQVECQEALERALAALSSSEKRLFLLKYQMGLTSAEISSLLGIRPDSVKAMLWRVRKKLRDYLEREEES